MSNRPAPTGAAYFVLQLCLAYVCQCLSGAGALAGGLHAFAVLVVDLHSTS